ncbi:metallophosphoesterase [Sporolactobacillus shoreicorticis]|uniref:Metallophosphoesterase n=1 Tax=Sporolactobacillus shoreicorticis TaxID=1923877 RepID=A0ABW5RZC9_9BACL|nr:metallophosphoesterase [Sporolactobacillus shoreicorticis]MCO7126739.1 metallophosphoesterase [Sporolactobacillus shoreicorticis]
MTVDLLAAMMTFFVLLIAYMFREAHLNRLISINLEFDELPEPFIGEKLFFISDIHRRTISKKWIDSFMYSPDYILIGGDLAEKGVPLARVRKNIKILSEIAPVFFIWGNHDWDFGYDRLKKLLDESDVVILDNTTYSVRKNGATLNFSGVNDLLHHHANLNKTLAARKNGAPTLLFSHNPNIKKVLTKRMGIAYCISGHTHSGQINLFGFTLKEKAGVKELPFGTLIISSGYGTTKLPLRLGAKPDALMLTFMRKQIENV